MFGKELSALEKVSDSGDNINQIKLELKRLNQQKIQYKDLLSKQKLIAEDWSNKLRNIIIERQNDDDRLIILKEKLLKGHKTIDILETELIQLGITEPKINSRSNSFNKKISSNKNQQIIRNNRSLSTTKDNKSSWTLGKRAYNYLSQYFINKSKNNSELTITATTKKDSIESFIDVPINLRGPYICDNIDLIIGHDNSNKIRGELIITPVLFVFTATFINFHICIDMIDVKKGNIIKNPFLLRLKLRFHFRNRINEYDDQININNDEHLYYKIMKESLTISYIGIKKDKLRKIVYLLNHTLADPVDINESLYDDEVDYDKKEDQHQDLNNNMSLQADIINQSTLLNISELSQLLNNIPDRFLLTPWKRCYLLSVDGASVDTLLKKLNDDKVLCCLLIIQDEYDKIFGAFCVPSLQYRHDELYYGLGECFVYAYDQKNKANVNIYRSSEENDFHLWTSKSKGIGIGGGNAFALRCSKTFQKMLVNHVILIIHQFYLLLKILNVFKLKYGYH